MAAYPAYLEQILMNHTGLPIGRRAMGFGASPLGPGGPHPAHQMNFLGDMSGMGSHGMMGSPYAAGQYPYPMPPMSQLGMLAGGGITPLGGCIQAMNPMALSYSYGDTGIPSYMNVVDAHDDRGFWDGDEDSGESDIFDQFMRRQRERGRGRGRRRDLSSFMLGLGMM